MQTNTEINPADIAADVDRGLAIVAKIDDLKEELKAIEIRLAAAALVASKEGLTEPLVDEEREGQRYFAEGSGVKIPIILESDQISGQFAADTDKHAELASLCGERLPHLYKRKVIFEMVPKDGKLFRRQAKEFFSPDVAAKIVSAAISRNKDGIPKSRVIVAWDQA